MVLRRSSGVSGRGEHHMLKLSAGNAIVFPVKGEKVEMQNVLECKDIDILFKIKYIYRLRL